MTKRTTQQRYVSTIRPIGRSGARGERRGQAAIKCRFFASLRMTCHPERAKDALLDTGVIALIGATPSQIRNHKSQIVHPISRSQASLTLRQARYTFWVWRRPPIRRRLLPGNCSPAIMLLFCGDSGHKQWWPARTRLEVILGAILTQNTAWHNATLALRKLRQAGLLSWRGLRAAGLDTLEACVRPAGFYRQKARAIRNFVDWLEREHEGSLSRLFSLPHGGPPPAGCWSFGGWARKRPMRSSSMRPSAPSLWRMLIRGGFCRGTVSSPLIAGYHKTQEFLHTHLPREARFLQRVSCTSGRGGKEALHPALPELPGVPAGGIPCLRTHPIAARWS